MSRPVAVMNWWNSSTVTTFVDMANGRPMITQCCGLAKDTAPLSAGAEPCLNRPAGSTVMAGHVGQSRISVPGFGTAGGDAATGAGTGARWTENQATTAHSNTAAPAPVARAITPGFIARPTTPVFMARPTTPGFRAAGRSGAENSATNCPTVGVRLLLSGCRPCTRAEY